MTTSTQKVNELEMRKKPTEIYTHSFYCEVFHSVHSRILITSSILQPNAHFISIHYMFATYNTLKHAGEMWLQNICSKYIMHIWLGVLKKW